MASKIVSVQVDCVCNERYNNSRKRECDGPVAEHSKKLTVGRLSARIALEPLETVNEGEIMAIGKVIANNKKARHEFFIEDTFETGIVLTGTEVKSIRAGKVNIKESYANITNGEVFITGMHISPYEQGNRYNVDPLRSRKLLLHKREINKLIGYTQQDGLTLVPLKVYISPKGYVKVELAIARGKKLHDKRQSIAKRDADKRMKQSLGRRR